MPLTSAGAAASAGMDVLAPVPVMLKSVCFKPRGASISSPVLGGDYLTDSTDLSALDHLWASLIDLKKTFLK